MNKNEKEKQIFKNKIKEIEKKYKVNNYCKSVQAWCRHPSAGIRPLNRLKDMNKNENEKQIFKIKIKKKWKVNNYCKSVPT